MKRNAVVVLICITLILAPGSSVANPGGNGDGNRETNADDT